MCGIAGFIDFSNVSKEHDLHAMTQTLAHRGPDGGNVKFVNAGESVIVGLGHRRLSIIDLSEGGSQPMNLGALTITFNGEIYNYKELQTELTKIGCKFSGQSDTEVILHAYRQWGASCIKKFIGMFAFVIYDQSNNQLFCARDRAGVKPFFYYWHNDLFLFASELKAFHKHPQFRKELNLHAVAAYMKFGNVPTPHCIFKNCFKLQAGHTLTFNLSTKIMSIHRYWNVYESYNQPKLKIPFSEALIETEKLLLDAFSYRMVSDVPVGIFLSGGYDSTCLTALLQKDKTEKLQTFTVAVPDIGLNEAPYAKEVANYIGTNHTEIMCAEDDVLNLISDLPYYYDEPFADSSAIPTSLVCKMARQQVKVVLSADGGDEVFAGYNRYDYLIKYSKILQAMPAPLRNAAHNIMNRVSADNFPFLKNTYNFHNRYEKLKLLLRDPSPKNMMLSLSKQYDETQIKGLFNSSVFPMNTAYQSNDLLEEFYTPLSYMMAIDYQTYLIDDILQKVDRASMSASLEAREPFLDQRIIEYAARLPDSYKYHRGEKKYILKEIVHKHIPKKLVDRPKMGFAIPIEAWLMTNLRPQVEYFLRDEFIEQQGIFNAAAIQNLKKQFFAGRKELALKIWTLLMFEMWYEKWMK